MQLPNKLYDELPVAAQTAFANLEKAAKERDFNRSVADIRGTLAKKTIKGSVYWYYQTKDPDGKTQQVYLGPDGPFIQDLIAARSDPKRIQSAAQLARLSASAVALGCANIAPKHGRVIRRIAEYGFFKAGGVLAGTHAFLAYQNLLGISWEVGQMTMDLDFAHPGKNVTIAFPHQIKVDMQSALTSLNMGFIPIHGQARFKKEDEPDFDVDFLTIRTRAGEAPIEVKSLGISLQPLKFMELAFEQAIQTVLLLNDGPVVVSVPNPAFFEFHKLIVSVERKTQDPLKANKDMAQAAALMEYYLDHNTTPLLDAYAHVIARGPGWKQRLSAGLKSLEKAVPHLHIRERLEAAKTALEADN
jgi:hypothetical protein